MKKRYWLAIICALLALSALALLPFTIHTASAEGETSGQCGDDLYWSFDEETGTLTITGSGDMSDYDAVSSVPWAEYKTSITEIVFPNGITSIGKFAFYGFSQVIDIAIPDGVTHIGSYALANCSNLITLELPESLTEIDYEGIRDCIQLKTITMPCSVTIKEQAFVNCKAIATVHLSAGTGLMPDYQRFDSSWSDYYLSTPWNETREEVISIILDEGITRIGGNAFYGCEKIRTIVIPDSVESIGGSAFCNCRGLKSAEIGDHVTTIGGTAFASCTALETLVIWDGVSSIEKEAFSGCSALEEITIPCSASIADNTSFKNCTAVSKVHITSGNGTMTDYQAFYSNHPNYCGSTPWYISRENLRTIVLDDGIISIGGYAFGGCIGLSSIEIPDSVTSIGSYAFSDCNNLQTVTIGNSTSYIGNSAFHGCTELSSVFYHGTQRTRSKIAYGDENTLLQNATWYYLPVLFIEIKSLPQKLVYHAGEKFSAEGASISTYYAYDIEEEETVTEEMVTGYDPDSPGLQTLTVTFDSKATSFDVTVNPHIAGNPVYENTVDPTCTEEGQHEKVVYCTICGVELSRVQETIPAYGHSWGEPFYTWADDNSSVTAIHVCTENSTHVETETVSTTSKVTKPATHTTMGETTYKATFSNPAFKTQTKTVANIPKLPLIGTIEWNNEDVQFRGATPYVVANGQPQTPRFSVKDENGNIVDPSDYTFEYRENLKAGTGYVFITFKGDYVGTCRGQFKIYLPATTSTTVTNVQEGIKVTWKPVDGAAGYVIYRRAWSTTTNGWTEFTRWDNTTGTTYLDGHDDAHKVYAGTRYQYGVKAYFARRTDPVTGGAIGGNVNNDSGNFNLGLVGPLKTTVRITTRTLSAVEDGLDQVTVRWDGSSVFTGYQVQYATDSSFTNAVTITISNPKTTQRVIKPSTMSAFGGTTYFVRVRSYHIFSGVTYYGGWSEIKNGVSAPKYRAIIIGESAYSGSDALPGCANDAVAMTTVLNSVQEPFCIKTGKNVGRKWVFDAIEQMSIGTTDQSVSVFYFSGHGLSSDGATENGALVTVDYKYITFSTLAYKLSGVNGRVIVILDSCHSGASIGKSINAENALDAFNEEIIEAFSRYDFGTGVNTDGRKSGELKKSKYIVITAASANQSSWDGKYDGSGYRQGAFTAALVKGMGCRYLQGVNTGVVPADANKNNKVTLKELFTYTYNTAYSWTKNTGSPQRAQYYGNDNEVLFSR